MFHKHKFEYCGFNILPSPSIAHLLCTPVYKCSKCKKVKIGSIRQLTEQEKLEMAYRYKLHLEECENDS